MSTGDKIAFVSLIVAIAAFLISGAVAVYTVWRANKTASAGALIAVQAALRDGWERYLTAPDDKKDYQFAELVNLLETCCLLHSARSFTGNPRRLIGAYLIAVLKHLSDSEEARLRLRALSENPKTFEHIRAFERTQRSSLSLSNPLFMTEVI